MKALTIPECRGVYGGTVLIFTPTDFVITGNSSLTYGNVTFRYNSICQNNTCIQNNVNSNLNYSFSGFYINGNNNFTVTASPLDGGGSVYHLS